MSKSVSREFVLHCTTEPLDIKDCTKLFQALKRGEPGARERLIEGNVGLVIWKVDNYIACNSQYSYLRDDLVSEGMLTLIKAIDLLKTRPLSQNGKAIVAYLGNSIWREIGKYAEQDSTIHVARRSRDYRRKSGKTVPTTISMSDVTLSDNHGVDPCAMPDLRDTLNACCHNDTERELLRLLEVKTDMDDMVERLDMSKTTIYAMKQTIYARYLTQTQAA